MNNDELIDNKDFNTITKLTCEAAAIVKMIRG